jgi:hypothetical protein
MTDPTTPRTDTADPAACNVSALDVVDRLLDNLEQFIDEHPDPGTEAPAARWEARQLLRRHERVALLRTGRGGGCGGGDVVTLCGSMRFLPQMLHVAAEETLAGAIVLAPFAVVPATEQDGEVKARLDELHRRKIDLADRVIVVSDASGYYGTSTRGEIDYAAAHGKPVTLRRVELHAVDLRRVELPRGGVA